MKHFGHATAEERVPYQARIVEAEPVTLFRCRCKRVVPEDMMLDLGPSGTVAEELKALAGNDRYRCDGCWRAWLLRGRVDVASFRAATEQPPPREGAKW